MTRKSFAVGAALVIGMVALAFASPALADDETYCARPYAQQNVYGNGYRYDNQGYGYARPHGHSRQYGQNRYSQPYSRNYGGQVYQPDYGRQSYSPDYGGQGYQPDYNGQYSSNYGGQSYSPEYGNGYGYQGYGTGVVHEDHTQTSFNPFPLPHFEKRTIHHQHPY